jgi:maltose alpha-D-glucosyltransferase/alpha-amylase
MVEGNRRRMELAYSLLFSLPGTPVLFYGEEIGLGDDQDVPDRGAVRPPMQWTDEPGGGFTTADEAGVPRRPIRDGAFGYLALNAEQQEADRDSFLNWMERAIRTRKEWPEFGWGEWQVLGTHNPRVLAHVATWDGSSVLALHNFSDAPARATVRLPEDARDGRWRPIFGRRDGEPPEVAADGRVSVELPAYGYAWLGRRRPV